MSGLSGEYVELASTQAGPTNSSQGPFVIQGTIPFSAPLYAVWIDAVGFSSLARTFAAAAVVVLKQCLHLYA
ncbi:hypothetical protein BD413DRAFT_614271 [Trametes elegans]|nr:hypothetical protein BD413DRAFT_614271 [Trametes elegans]